MKTILGDIAGSEGLCVCNPYRKLAIEPLKQETKMTRQEAIEN